MTIKAFSGATLHVKLRIELTEELFQSLLRS